MKWDVNHVWQNLLRFVNPQDIGLHHLLFDHTASSGLNDDGDWLCHFTSDIIYSNSIQQCVCVTFLISPWAALVSEYSLFFFSAPQLWVDPCACLENIGMLAMRAWMRWHEYSGIWVVVCSNTTGPLEPPSCHVNAQNIACIGRSKLIESWGGLFTQQRRLLPHSCVGLLLFSLTSGGAPGNLETHMRSAPMSWAL